MKETVEKEARRIGIGRRRIERLRRKTRVGSIIPVRSVKASIFGSFDGDVKKGSTPIVRAKVLSTDSKYFCLVQLSGGAIESILWIDMLGTSLDKY